MSSHGALSLPGYLTGVIQRKLLCYNLEKLSAGVFSSFKGVIRQNQQEYTTQNSEMCFLGLAIGEISQYSSTRTTKSAPTLGGDAG